MERRSQEIARLHMPNLSISLSVGIADDLYTIGIGNWRWSLAKAVYPSADKTTIVQWLGPIRLSIAREPR